MREKPAGIKGLSYVLSEIYKSQNAGLILRTPPSSGAMGKFAKMMRQDIKFKISK